MSALCLLFRIMENSNVEYIVSLLGSWRTVTLSILCHF